MSAFTFPARVLPDNERSADILQKEKEEEELRRAKLEEMRALKEKEERSKRAKANQQEAERLRKERAAKDFETKQKEMQEQMQKVDGKMQFMLYKLQENQTPFEYSASGLELNAYRTKAFAQFIAYNQSLLSMDFARQGIQDLDGTNLAEILYTNKTLRKLELEGNLLGPKTAAKFGEVLKTNKTLRYLDLESNQLTLDGQDMSGVQTLMDFLDNNDTLLSLNLANNQIDQKCGAIFVEKLRNNYSLIDFDFSRNKDIKLEDSRQIQEYLKRNKAMFDAERLKEWKERKGMKGEDEKNREFFLANNAKKEQARMEEEAAEVRESELDEKWKKYMLETQIEKQQLIQQLMEAAKLRGGKGKKKKGKKKK